MKKRLKPLFFTLICMMLIAPMSVFGQGGLDISAGAAGYKVYKTSNTQLEGYSPLIEITGRIIFAFLGILGAVFLFFILLGGFEWMSAGGNEDKVKHAKSMITNAILGIIITMVSYALAGAIISSIATASIATIGS